MIYRSTFCTLDNIITQMSLPDSSALNVGATAQAIIGQQNADVQTYLKQLIWDVSDMIALAADRTFVPYDFTHYHDPRDVHKSNLWLRDDLLSVTTVTNGDAAALTASEYRLLDRGLFPAWGIKALTASQGASWTFSDNDSQIAIVGTWGYHANPTDMWVDSGVAIPVGDITSSATSVTLSSISPFETYQYIKVESEYIHITDIDTGTKTLTLTRGVNGSTAATHVATSAIYTYRQTDAIAKECRRLVVREFHLRGGINVVATGETAFELKPGSVKLPSHLIRKRMYAV